MNIPLLTATSNSTSNRLLAATLKSVLISRLKLQLQSFSYAYDMQKMTPKTLAISLLNMLGFKLKENLRIKKRGQTNGRMNLVTESLLELLIAANNTEKK